MILSALRKKMSIENYSIFNNILCSKLEGRFLLIKMFTQGTREGVSCI